MRERHRIWIACLLLAGVISTAAAYMAPVQTRQVTDSIGAQPLSYTSAQLVSAVSLKINGCIECEFVFRMSDSTPAATLTEESPVVRAVMFWINGCPGCHHVLENVLPHLQMKYGNNSRSFNRSGRHG
jgi:hypothetical protein